jgi:GT2 family glycosyltransferase
MNDDDRTDSGVFVATLSPDYRNAHFDHAFERLLDWDRQHSGRITDRGDVCSIITGPRIAAARNALVRTFLGHEKQPPWMLMLDSDMVFAPTVAEQLVCAADPVERPVIGGLCFAGGRSGEIRPTMSVMVTNTPPTFEPVWNYQPDALNGVDYTGAACLLVHRRVFEDLARRFDGRAYLWFAESEVGENEYGEDVTFCMRVRAAGYPIYVNTGVKVGHMKMQVLDEESYLVWRRGITAHGQDSFTRMELDRRFV